MSDLEITTAIACFALVLAFFGFFIGAIYNSKQIEKLNDKCNSLEEANATLLKMHSKLFDDVSILRGDLNDKINKSSLNIVNLQIDARNCKDAINKLARHTEYPKSKIV